MNCFLCAWAAPQLWGCLVSGMVFNIQCVGGVTSTAHAVILGLVSFICCAIALLGWCCYQIQQATSQNKLMFNKLEL